MLLRRLAGCAAAEGRGAVSLNKLCEGCGTKRANFGLPDAERKCRWCSGCSQAHRGAVNLSKHHTRLAHPRAARPSKKRRRKALAQGKPVATTATPPAEMQAAAQPSMAAARKCGPATEGAGSTQGRRRGPALPGAADEPPLGKRRRGVAGGVKCPPLQVFTITAALFEPESGSDDEGGDDEIKLEEQQQEHDEQENEQQQQQQELDDDDDDWL